MKTPWHDHPLARELDVALAAVREAGLLCREVQAAIDPGAMQKKDEPVTVADYGSQALVCRALAAAFPADPVIGEEDSAELREVDNAALLAQVVTRVRERAPTPTWTTSANGSTGATPGALAPVLDPGPIDGTKGFLRGEQYAVGLALITDGEVVCSALACPTWDPGWTAIGAPAPWWWPCAGWACGQLPMAAEGRAAACRVSPEPDPALIRFCESSRPPTRPRPAAQVATELAIRAVPRRLDSMTKYAVVARGEAEAYLRLPRNAEYREKIWDHAAGVLAVAEAGGRVTDIHGRDLDFGLGYQLGSNLGVVVSNGVVHEPIMAVLRKLGIGEF